jgi:auxin efflux carrier family protein
MSGVGSSLGPAFLGALEGSISVLLTLSAGYYTGRIGLLDHGAVTRISKLCSNLLLPCLIVEQMGPELTATNLSKLWILPVWGVLSTALAHLVGWLGQVVLKTPHWVIVASGRPNSSALPLLLLQSLESTGILNSLDSTGASSSKLLSRAKSYILLNVIVQQSITFQTAPNILKMDDGEGQDDEERGPASLTPAAHKSAGRLNPIVQDRDRVGLLEDYDGASYGTREETHFPVALSAIEDRPDIHWPRKLQSIEKPIKAVIHWMSPPLIGAIIALVLGVRCGCLYREVTTIDYEQIVPLFHEVFFSQDSALYSSVTQSIENIGEL